MIAPELFAKAQLLAERRRRLTNQEALDRLSALWRKKGHLSHKIIVAADNVPDTSTYIKRFGSLSSAYKLIGFSPRPRYRWLEIQKRLRLLTNEVVEDIVGMILGRGGVATFDESARLLTVDKRFTVAIGTAWHVSENPKRARWHVRINRNTAADLALVVRMDPSHAKVMDYYLLPQPGWPKQQ